MPEQLLFLRVLLVLLFNGYQSVVDKVPSFWQAVQPVGTLVQTYNQIEGACMGVYGQYLILRTFHPDSITHHTHLNRICGMAHLAAYAPVTIPLDHTYCSILFLCAFCLMQEAGRCCRCDFQQSTDQHQYYQYSFHHDCALIIQISMLLGQRPDEIVYCLACLLLQLTGGIVLLASLNDYDTTVLNELAVGRKLRSVDVVDACCI